MAVQPSAMGWIAFVVGNLGAVGGVMKWLDSKHAGLVRELKAAEMRMQEEVTKVRSSAALGLEAHTRKCEDEKVEIRREIAHNVERIFARIDETPKIDDFRELGRRVDRMLEQIKH